MEEVRIPTEAQIVFRLGDKAMGICEKGKGSNFISGRQMLAAGEYTTT